MRVTVDWLGDATFRLTVGERVIFLDAYIDRVPAAPPVVLSAGRVKRADNLLDGTSHLGDLSGAHGMLAHLRASDRHPRTEGGSLAYLIETPAGSMLWKDTSGHWTGILRDLRPDVAILAAVGRGNVDGEPVQGTLADFVASEVELLRPRTVVLCHHDDWMPPLTRPTDVAPIRRMLAARTPGVEEDQTAGWYGYLAQYQLGSTVPVLRTIVQQSNCFVIVERGRGMNNMMMERQLKDSGEMRAKSNFGKGQMVAADYTMQPTINFSQKGTGGLGAALGGLVPGGAVIAAAAGR